ncbi:hypothetical protein LEN26_017332 [Aphanomyces euteiches]|nr:hypothetical protein LEN26_017332 [Aphanomyces euteiches]
MTKPLTRPSLSSASQAGSCCQSSPSSHILTAATTVFVKGTVQTNPHKADFNVTFYMIRIACPLTKCLWSLRQRFSQVYATRKAILSRMTAYPPPLQQELMSLLKSFPRRRLGVDDAFVIAERAEGLRQLVMALMQVRELCHSQENKEASLGALVAYIEEMLDMPPAYRNFQSTVDEDGCLDATDDAMCSICLEDMEADDSCVRLRCHHIFHTNCVSEWLRGHFTCPLCRDDV